MSPNPITSVLLLLGVWSSLHGQALAQTQAALAYAPVYTPCPAGTNLVRAASQSYNGKNVQSLGSLESAYVSKRETTVLPGAWSSYFDTVSSYARSHNLSSGIPTYLSQILTSRDYKAHPRLGLASSGGGYRAAIFGAGVLDALDGRNATSVNAGLGGLLQSATYLTGLSGGSWLVLSLAQAGFPQLPDLIFGALNSSGWNAQFDIIQAGGTDAALTAQFISTLVQEIAPKLLTGFPVTFTDVWSRALARHFVSGTNGSSPSTFFDTNSTHGAGVTLSSLTGLATFQNHAQPFPIVVANAVSPNANFSNLFNESGIFVPLSNTVYEFNPGEMGSFDPTVSAFTPTRYLGSPNNSLCVTNFDQLSFVEAISSSLFNEFNTSVAALESSSIGPIIDILNGTFHQPSFVQLDSAAVPNPFFGFNSNIPGYTNLDVGERFLKLVDGGENGEIDPLQPLLVQARGVDTIFTIDAPADNAQNFAEGFSIIATQQRSSLFSKFYSFPPVPTSVAGFAAANLTKQPTFFGCNTPTSGSLQTPLLIYLAKWRPSTWPITAYQHGHTANDLPIRPDQRDVEPSLRYRHPGYPTNQ
ncbi:hypothetical protein QCA50_005904 [Cerrena zonata]|uniref:Lysophospholipase n=1 Tax=Cerrena zonata TaxID=2478898 RepID=A0AAW0GME7_9APHY